MTKNDPVMVFIRNGYIFTHDNINSEKYRRLSASQGGYIFEKRANCDVTVKKVGRFVVCPILVSPKIKPKIVANIYYFWKVWRVIGGLRRRPGVVITYDPFLSGVFACIIKRVLNIPVLVEVNGNYLGRDAWEAYGANLTGYLKYLYCKIAIPMVVNCVDGIKLLYPTQLGKLGAKESVKIISHVFHEFTPVEKIVREYPRGNTLSDESDSYILFLGMPLYVKGVDILIRAFRSMEHAPDVKLKIVGWFPGEEGEEVDRMIGNDERITRLNPVAYPEAISLIEGCKFLVLPSRTEAMGRVLLEAMAFEKAVIASNVDGIPTYVEDEKNGLLFNVGDHSQLAIKMRELIDNPQKAQYLGGMGKKYVLDVLSETAYVENYRRMVSSVL